MSPRHLLIINEPSDPTSKRCLTDPQTSSDCGETKRRKTSSCSSISSPVALTNELLVESIKFLDFETLNKCREVVRRWNNLIVDNRSHLALQFLNHSFIMDFNEYNRELTRCSQLTCLQTCSKIWGDKSYAVISQLIDKPIILTNTESKDVILTIRDESETRGSSRQLSLVYITSLEIIDLPVFIALYLSRSLIEKFTSYTDIDGLLYNIQLNGYQRSANPIICASSFISADKEPNRFFEQFCRHCKTLYEIWSIRKEDYSSVDYWNSRFDKEAAYEWIADFKQFSPLILPVLKPTDKILHLGCGNSKLSFQLQQAGFPKITNVDYSSTLIEKRAEQYADMKWICDDMRSLSNVPSDYFDVVIEKSAIESLLANEKSQWCLSDSGKRDLQSTLSSIHRILKPGGIFISISFTSPIFRVPYLVEQNWDCSVKEFGDSFHYYCYQTKKGKKADLDYLEKYLCVNRQ
uniref:Methyltransferase type 11 domain-containing protein n=1 Tax=Ditylenchus dipsaci TaxID=166011 RepID=A0A915DQV8_9BILA